MEQITNYPAPCKELKFCPFCGATPVWYLQGNEKTHTILITILCGTCGAKQETGAIHLSTEWLKDKAIEKWNKRC